jgi:phosphonate transport system permease protein
MWALLFLSAVGTSPLAAVLAMALPYGGTLAKIFSELLDESESSAAWVIRMSGGGGLAAFSAGVVTKALPDLVTYALYRLECAIRSSAVLGFVGVPTLGYEIKTAYEDGHYREIWTYLYVLLAVVIFFEWWGGKMRNLLTKGIPSRKTGVSQPDIAQLWKSRGTSFFLRSSLLVFLIGGTMSWALEDRWGAGVSWEQRMRNLDRFTGEIVPYPVREADGDWREFGSWFGEKMSEGGSQAVWQTFHLGTASILLAGALSLIVVGFSARTLASSRPRGIWDGCLAWRAVIGSILRAVAMLGRAMPEFILAFLLLRIFGPTVWALILALAIHNCGILMRLGAEVIDNTTSRASSVILAQGGSRSSSYIGALVPAGFTRMVLFLFYRWESCIREATVLGMLGVASLGLLISDAKVSLYYDEMVLWVALGAALVFLGDLSSDFVRYKLRGKNNR